MHIRVEFNEIENRKAMDKIRTTKNLVLENNQQD